MGQNIILNAADHGFNVIAFNRTTSKVDRFLENEAKGMIIPPSFFWQIIRVKKLILAIIYRQIHRGCTLN